MAWGWQDIAALAVVGICLAYLVRLAWRTVARKVASGCAVGCGTCPAATGARRKAPNSVDGMVSLDALTRGPAPRR